MNEKPLRRPAPASAPSRPMRPDESTPAPRPAVPPEPDESVAGEEDPGASFDLTVPPGGTRPPAASLHYAPADAEGWPSG